MLRERASARQDGVFAGLTADVDGDRRATVHGDLPAAIVRHVRDVVSVVGADGVVRYLNQAVAELAGVAPDVGCGSQADSWVHPDDREHSRAQRAYLLGGPGRVSTAVVRVRRPDGGYRHVESTGVNRCDDPDIRGLLYVTRDVEERAQAEDALLRALGAQRVVTELGVLALRGDDLDTVLDEALQRVGAVLGAQWISIGRCGPDDVMRILRQSGPAPADPGTPWVQGRPPGVAAGLAGWETPLHGPGERRGVLCAHGSRPPSTTHRQFLQGVAEVLSGALLREARQRAAVTDALRDGLTGLVTRPVTPC